MKKYSENSIYHIGWLLLLCFVAPSTDSIPAQPSFVALAICYICTLLFAIFFFRYNIWLAVAAITAGLVAILLQIFATMVFAAWHNNIIAVAKALQMFSIAGVAAIALCSIIHLAKRKFIFLACAIACYIFAAALGSGALFQLYTFLIIAAALGWLYFVWASHAIAIPKSKSYARIYILLGLSGLVELFAQATTIDAKGVGIVFFTTMLSGIAIYALWQRVDINPFNVKRRSVLLLFVALAAIAAKLGLSAWHWSASTNMLSITFCAIISVASIILWSSLRLDQSKFIKLAILIVALIAISIFVLFDILLLNVIYIFLLAAITAAVLYIALVAQELCQEEAATQAEQAEIIIEEDIHTNTDQLSIKSFDSFMAYALNKITGQELRIAELILRGHSTPEIATVMSLAENTIRSYRKTLYSKLEIHSKLELFQLAEKMNK